MVTAVVVVETTHTLHLDESIFHPVITFHSISRALCNIVTVPFNFRLIEFHLNVDLLAVCS